jgi:hypothetical protein
MMALLMGTLLVFGNGAGAVPTGTTYRIVQTDTNGVLVGPSTNLASANGLATVGQVAGLQAVALTLDTVIISTNGIASISTNYGSIHYTGTFDDSFTPFTTNYSLTAYGSWDAENSMPKYHLPYVGYGYYYDIVWGGEAYIMSGSISATGGGYDPWGTYGPITWDEFTLTVSVDGIVGMSYTTNYAFSTNTVRQLFDRVSLLGVP